MGNEIVHHSSNVSLEVCSKEKVVSLCVMDFSIVSLNQKLSDSKESFKILQSLSLLRKNVLCKKCREPMALYDDKTAPDGVIWRCRRSSCTTNVELTVRDGSIFSGSKISLANWCNILFMFSRDIPAYLCQRLMKPDVSYNSVLNCYDFFRRFCKKYNEANPVVFDGPETVLLMDQNLDIERNHS